MALFTWTDGLSVGHLRIDSQHKTLIGLINELHDAMKQGQAKTVMAKILKELIGYTSRHFSAEEKFMARHGYPHYLAHKAQHAAFINRTLRIQQGFETGNAPLSMDVMDFLKDWLSDHICVVDKQYSSFFEVQGFR